MKKRAFLFSAETYQASKSLIVKDLPGCEYDILAMQKRLLQIGFDVKSVRNATKDDYFSTLQDVAKGTPNDAIQIVYFTGHGGHYKGVNYILPVDSGTRLDASGDIKQSAIDINGWFHTGDLAKIDKDGYIYIRGRKKSVIVLNNGKNVFPEEIENLLNKVEGIKESLVYEKKEDDGDVKVCCKIV